MGNSVPEQPVEVLKIQRNISASDDLIQYYYKLELF